MFDFDAAKFLIIGIVALIVIGPKELPRVLRQVGQTVGRVRRMAAEFQGQFMDAMKEADIESIREDLKKIGNDAEIHAHFDPARDIQRELTTSLEQPAAAAAVPAMTELPEAATGGFALPAPDVAALDAPAPEEPAPTTLAASGIAPTTVPDDEAAPVDAALPPVVNGAVVFPPATKRKIRMLKRPGVATNRVHLVTDRTAPIRARVGLLRGQEVAGR